MGENTQRRADAGGDVALLQARIDELERRLGAPGTAEAGRHEAERFRKLVDSVGVIMWEADPTTWQFTFVSEQAEQITGYPAEEWLTTDFWTRVMHPDDRDDAVRLCRTTTARCESHDFQYRMIAADGRVIWIRDIVTVVAEGGRPVLLRGVMIDITAIKQAEHAMRYRLEIESLVASISAEFVRDDGRDVDRTIHSLLARLGEFAGVDRSYVFLLSSDGRTMSNTHEWCARGIRPEAHTVQSFDVARIPWWMERLKRNETIHLSTLDELPPEAAVEREFIEAQSVQSLVCVPIVVSGELLGFLGFDAVKGQQRWVDEDIRLLKTVAETFGSAIARQRSEQAVRESERRYRLLFEHNPNPMWVYDAKSLRFLAVNESAVCHYGYTRDEFLTMTIRDVQPEEDVKELESPLSGARPGGRQWAGVRRHRRKDGSDIRVESISHGLDFDGRPARLVMAHDVTDRENAVAALRTSEQRLRLLAGQNPAVMWSTDQKLRFTSVQGTGLRGFELKPDEIVGWTLQEYFEVDDPSNPPIEAHRRALRGQSGEFSLEWKGKCYQCAVEPLRNTAGEIIGTVGIALDSTERLLAERALEESEHRWRTVFESALDPLWDWDVVTDRTQFSPSWARLLGYDPAEFDPSVMTWQSLVHPDDKTRVAAFLAATLEGQTSSYEAEYRVHDADGSWRWVYSRGQVIARDEAGRPLRMIGSLRDMTARRELEDALRHRIASETMVSAISTHFINLAPDQIDAGIDEALRRIGEFTDVDRSYLFLFSPDGRTMSNTHEWCAGGIEPHRRQHQGIASDSFPWWLERLRRFETIHVERVDDLPVDEAAAERRILQEQRIRSLLLVPVAIGGALIGFLGFDAVDEEKHWSPEDAALLGAIGEIIANALDRQRAENELREKERFLSTLFSNLPGWVYRCRNDADWTFEFASGGIEEVTGYAAQVFYTKDPVSFNDIIHPDDRDRIWTEVQSALERRESFQLMYRIRTAEGPERWLWEQGRGVFDRDGNVLALEGVINDITNQRRAETALREFEERFAAFMRHNPAAAWIKDRDGRYVFINDTLERVWHQSLENVVGKSDFDLLPDAVAEQFRANDKRVLRQNEPIETYENMPHRDGTVHMWLVLKFPLQDASGRRMIGGIAFDRTDDLRAESELRRREREFKALVENTPDLVTRIDREFANVYLNPAAAAAFGVPAGPQQGLSFDELLLSEAVRRQLREKFANVVESRRELVAEFEVGAPHRSEHYEARLVPEFAEDGSVESVLMIGRKITERKIAEAELRYANDRHRLLLRELDHRVRNNLAALLALIDISSRRSSNPVELAASIRGRVQAMSAVHDLLSKGRKNAVELVDLLGSLVPSDMQEQVRVTGPNVAIAANQGTALGMIVQELVANSLKYGAMQAPGGMVDVSWKLAEVDHGPERRRLEFSWVESGGPPIARSPAPGLGSNLITGLVRSELRGEAILDYRDGGASHCLYLHLDPVNGFEESP